MGGAKLRNVDKDGRKEEQNVHCKNGVPHVQLVLVALVTVGTVQSYPIRIETSGHGSAHPAVVGRQWGVVQPPVAQVIHTAVHIPEIKVVEPNSDYRKCFKVHTCTCTCI